MSITDFGHLADQVVTLTVVEPGVAEVTMFGKTHRVGPHIIEMIDERGVQATLEYLVGMDARAVQALRGCQRSPSHD